MPEFFPRYSLENCDLRHTAVAGTSQNSTKALRWIPMQLGNRYQYFSLLVGLWDCSMARASALRIGLAEILELIPST